MNDKNFIKFFIAKLISQIGDSMFLFIISWHVLDITNSPLLASLLAASSAVPIIICTPFAGIVADKVSRKYLLTTTDIIRGILLIILLLLLRFETTYLLTFFIVVVLINIGTAFYLPASTAIIPNIVSEDKLTKANSLLSIITNLTLVIGFLIGGIFYTKLSIEWIFVINAVSFVVSGLLMGSITIFEKRQHGDKKSTFFIDMKAGFNYLVEKKKLYTLFKFFIFVNFILSPLSPVYLPYIFNQLLNMPAIYLSYTQFAYAAGYVLVAVVFSKINTKEKFEKYIIKGLKIECISILLIAIILFMYNINPISELRIFLLLILGASLLGSGVVVVNLHIEVYFQKSVQDEFRGRVSSFLATMSKLALPFGYLIGGVTLKFFELHYILFATTLIFTVIIGLMIRNGNIKENSLGKQV